MNTFSHLRVNDYASNPWKNGLGTTQDVVLLPSGSVHETFDCRIAISPIPNTARFSSFPGIDRVLTLIRGNGLTLDFDGRKNHLSLSQNIEFDSALAPKGTPEGEVSVINVMVRRGVWKIAECQVLTDLDAMPDITPQEANDLLFLIPLTGKWIFTVEKTTVELAALETLFTRTPKCVRVESRTGDLLLIRISKVISS